MISPFTLFTCFNPQYIEFILHVNIRYNLPISWSVFWYSLSHHSIYRRISKTYWKYINMNTPKNACFWPEQIITLWLLSEQNRMLVNTQYLGNSETDIWILQPYERKHIRKRLCSSTCCTIATCMRTEPNVSAHNLFS